MRETRLSGSEGGAGSIPVPTPIEGRGRRCHFNVDTFDSQTGPKSPARFFQLCVATHNSLATQESHHLRVTTVAWLTIMRPRIRLS